MESTFQDGGDSCHALALDERYTGMWEIIWAVELQSKVFGRIRSRPVLRFTGVVPYFFGSSAYGDAGING